MTPARRRHRHLAVLVRAAAALVVLTAASACRDSGTPDRDDSGAIVKAGDESVFDLAAGDCIQPPESLDAADIQQLRAVPCTEQHTHEVYATADYDQADVYPGEAALQAFADRTCLERFEDYVGIAYEESTLRFSYLFPSFPSWNDGEDRSVICFVVSSAAPMTTTAKGSAI